MYTTCECIKRNGLQDKCPRSMCQGRSACMCFPTPNCCPAAFPLRYANMTMGCNKRARCPGQGGCCPPPSPCCPAPCSGCPDPCGAPAPVPCSPSPQCCPPMPESGIPDPRIWNVCNTPPSYPCEFVCPSRYLKRIKECCNYPCPCLGHCYNTPPKPCC
ncbi:putative small proline-rich protein 5 [Teleopsis dalmanni]|uniref:putative small proline-rich protein 5 n=1 Tax=Teleopsis dalmanni TaxID=139649 RepID=UPI0018CD4668|nr:putative small proline-rich protein 5 [Teleopsis dalmanni]